MRHLRAFTLVELMVVILIVGILAAASVPLMRGRIDSAKWAEANATAGAIRTAHRVYFAEHGTGTTSLTSLGFTDADLKGTYFVAGDYTVGAADANGNVAVTVTGSQDNAPAGSRTLSQDGKTWASTGD